MDIKNNIIAFYLDSNSLKNELGFTFSDCISSFTYKELESCHGYIQWLFPLQEPSQFNPNAPYPTQEVIDAFTEYNILRDRIREAANMMDLWYCDTEYNHWITPNNHNFLRITRIIKSLKLFLPNSAYAKFFYNSIRQIVCDTDDGEDIVGEVTLKYWKDALDG